MHLLIKPCSTALSLPVLDILSCTVHCLAWQALQHHVKEEEEEMLPEFAGLVDRDALARLSEHFQKAKHRVPTR